MSTKFSEEVIQALAVFGSSEADPLIKVKQAYLVKTRENKFRKIIAGNKILTQEFSRLHSNYTRLLSLLVNRQDYADLNFENSEELYIYFFNQGVFALVNGDFLQANEKFQQAYNINKEDPLLLTYLGLLLMLRENYQIAEKFFEDALKIDPENENALYYAGENFRRANILFKALEYWEKLLAKGFSSYDVSFKVMEVKKIIELEEKKKRYAKYPFLEMFDKLFERFKKK